MNDVTRGMVKGKLGERVFDDWVPICVFHKDAPFAHFLDGIAVPTYKYHINDARFAIEQDVKEFHENSPLEYKYLHDLWGI